MALLGTGILIAGMPAAPAVVQVVTVPPPPGTPATASLRPTGSPPHVPQKSVDEGTVADSTVLQLSVLLRPRDPQGLASFARPVSTPGTAEFHHYLALGRFAQEFGPTPETLASVVAALESRGLHPQHLRHSTLGGSITVPKATSLAVINSVVNGSINATNKPNAIEVCGSNLVGGSVNVINAQSLVIIGDAGDANCAVNTISGTLLLQNNTHGVEAIGNTVGNLIATANSGPGPYPGDATTISGNIISH